MPHKKRKRRGNCEFLRCGYWHVTTPEAWRSIRKAGVIRPNDGSYPMRYPVQSQRSFAFINKYVSLFDFVGPSENQISEYWDRAWEVLVNPALSAVLICLDRRCLRHKIIPNREARNRDAKCEMMWIPYLEVWYPSEIPTTVVKALYRVAPLATGELRVEEVSKDADVEPIRPDKDAEPVDDLAVLLPGLTERFPDLVDQTSETEDDDPIERRIAEAEAGE